MNKSFIPIFVLGLCFGQVTVKGVEVISDDLQVTGTVDIGGNVLSLGSLSATPSTAGIVGTFSENVGGTTGSFFWSLNHVVGDWTWQRLSGDGLSYIPGMTLNAGNQLIIADLANPSDTSKRIVLAPGSAGASQVPGSITVLGTNNLLPNQTLDSNNSIVTRSLGDARYLAAGTTLAVGSGSTASQTGSISMGTNAVANGGSQTPSIALGKNVTTTATSDGLGSIALGWGAQAGTASRGSAVAIGENTQALGSSSFAVGFAAMTSSYHTHAIGCYAKATNGYAQAFGWLAESSGFASTALGGGTVANGFDQIVVGSGNAYDPSDDPLVRVPTQNLFVVGNGLLNTAPYTRSNAFTIKWNGDAWLLGNFTTDKDLTVTEDAAIGGSAAVEEDLSVGGKLEAEDARFDGTVRIAPKGGLSMGEFTYDPAGN